jgi:uncharacterized protein
MQPRALKHPGRWIWLVLLVPVALGLVRLRLDVEVFDLLPVNLKVVQGLKLYQEHFTNARQLLLTVKGPDPEQTESAARQIAESLRPHTNLVVAVNWEPPWLEHPDQAAELLAYLWFNEPPAVFDQLTNRLAPDQLGATLTNTREQLATSLSPEDIARLSYDPFGLTRLPESVGGAAPSFARGQELFSSPDGKFRILFVQARPELRSYRDCQRWLEAIKPLVEAAAAGAGQGTNHVTVGYTGRPALVAETAEGMQRDIIISVGGTAAIIAVLFWLAHRRVKPMLWLLTLLAAILACTLALGGLIFGTINVVSIGFAAILLGLAVDYAVVHYQEALAHPHLSIPQIRRAIAPSIFWAAVTTITAFLVLNLGGLPGLGQLGTLVALGVALAASIMIFEFLPPLFPGRDEPGPAPVGTAAPETVLTVRDTRARVRSVFGITGAVLVVTLVVLVLLGQPKIDPTANALRPLGRPAYAALEEIQSNLNQKREPLWLIVSGQTVPEVAQRLDRIQAALGRGVTNHLLAGFTLPAALWPRPEFQQENRHVAHQLAAERELLRQAAETNGFAPRSLALTERMLNTWEAASTSEGVFWPTNDMSRWILEKVTARSPTNYFALGFVTPESSQSAAVHAAVAQLEPELPEQGVWLSGWELLGNAIFSRVRANLWKVVAPMVVLVFLSLWFAFRRSLEILLSLFALILSGLCLLTVMRLAGWSWNLLNLMAIPLVLGTGVDYSIFMQLALRRFHGDLSMAYHSVGRALLLCGGTAIAAFASLTWSSNAGMASLGEVCAVGIAFNVVIAIFLAPVWWHATVGHAYRQA